MKKALVFAFLGMISLKSEGQYSGPAVEACREYAKKEELRYNQSTREIVFERDQALGIERYTRKVGNQFVSSVLTGNGVVVLAGAPSAELSFICLLADERHPVFFYWLPRHNTTAVGQCRRSGAPRPCLELLNQVAESDLAEVYALRFQEARQRDFDAKNEESVAAYRKANEEWLRYREAECARKRAIAPAGFPAEDYQLACIVDLTRRRALDMRD
jgi:uncharacterized protein YecT (DUF1311 family)